MSRSFLLYGKAILFCYLHYQSAFDILRDFLILISPLYFLQFPAEIGKLLLVHCHRF